MFTRTIVDVKPSRTEEGPYLREIPPLIHVATGETSARVLQTSQRAMKTLASVTEGVDIAVPSNPTMDEAHSEDGLVGGMLQLHDTNRFRAVRGTARVTGCQGR